MSAVWQLAYRRIPSFRREEGGLYHLYTAIYSRAYRARMIWLHKRGRHHIGCGYSVSPSCSWCGAPQ